MIKIIYFLALFFSVNGNAETTFIRRCKPNDQACMLKSAQKALPVVAVGVKQLYITPLDPLVIKSIRSNEAGLVMNFHDLTITGLKNCIILSFNQDMEAGTQTMAVQCSVTLRGGYLLDGRLIVMPIKGNSNCTIIIRDIVITAKNELSTVRGLDGMRHWHIKTFTHTYDTRGSAKFIFNDLFNGNKALSMPVETFLNKNWREVMQEVARPIVQAIVRKIVEAIEMVYKAIPVEELIDE